VEIKASRVSPPTPAAPSVAMDGAVQQVLVGPTADDETLASPTPQPPATPVAPPTVIDLLVGGELQPLPIKDPSPPARYRLSRSPSSARIFAGGISARYGSGCPVRRGVRHLSRRIRPRPSRPRPGLSAPVARRSYAPPARLRSRPPARCLRSSTRDRPRTVRTSLHPAAACAFAGASGRPPTCCRPPVALHRPSWSVAMVLRHLIRSFPCSCSWDWDWSSHCITSIISSTDGSCCCTTTWEGRD